jgi:uncharacterized protein (TIGR02172 family)
MYKIGKKIGSGRSSEVFGCGTDKVLKLFYADSKYNTIIWEYEKLTDAMSKGVPVPAVHEFIERNGRFGFVMDRVKGKPFWNLLIRHVIETGGEKNGEMSEFVADAVRLIARALHSVHSVKAELMDTSQMVLTRAARYNKRISDGEREMVLSVLDSLPNDRTVCHGDPNFDNILIDGGNAAYIDWYYMGSGYFMYDITEFVITARYLYMNPKVLNKRFIRFMEKYAEEIIKILFEEYTRVSGSEITDLDKWLIPSLTNRLNGGGCEEYKSRLLSDLRIKLALLRIR